MTILVLIAVALRIISNPLGNVFQKQLTSRGSNPLVVNFFTYLLLSLACLLFSFSVEWSALPLTFWEYSVLAGISGALGNGFLVKALHKGELSVLGPINSYKSVIAITGGVIMLSEIPGLVGIIGIVLIIFGSYFVLDTTSERFSIALFKRSDIRYRLLAMILTAVEAVFIKKIIISSSSTIAFFSWCFFGALFSFILLFVYRINLKKELSENIRSDNLIKYLLLIGCVGTMQFSTNYTFAHMQVGYALSLFQLSTIISIFFGYRFFKEEDILKKTAGSLIMITGSILIILFNS
jgi:drug/metabolite transporter (DMT)-like permease